MGGLGLEQVNRQVWSNGAVVRFYSRREGWHDPGEIAVVDNVAESVRDGQILDIGCGVGRTTSILLALSEDYVGVDYIPEMVVAARERFPGVRYEVGDARALKRFGAASFRLVFFSANGIDAVGREDRGKVLREAYRIVQPGGFFAFSAHNLAHPSVGQGPWSVRQLLNYRHPRNAAKRILHLPRSVSNHRRLSALAVDGDGWAIRNDCAHDFSIVIHYVTLEQQLQDLASAGFGEVDVFDSVTGARVYRTSETRTSFWLHYVARKPPTERTSSTPTCLNDG